MDQLVGSTTRGWRREVSAGATTLAARGVPPSPGMSTNRTEVSAAVADVGVVGAAWAAGARTKVAPARTVAEREAAAGVRSARRAGVTVAPDVDAVGGWGSTGAGPGDGPK